MGHNFRSDRWISTKLLLEFLDALSHEVHEGSILGDDEVCRARLDGRFERPLLSIGPLDRDQTFTGVSGYSFPCSG